MFGKDYINTIGSKFVAVGSSAATLTSALLPDKVYSLATSTGTWVKQGFGAQTAVAAAANNVLVPAMGTAFIHGSNGDTISVIQDSVAGKCSINLMTEI